MGMFPRRVTMRPAYDRQANLFASVLTCQSGSAFNRTSSVTFFSTCFFMKKHVEKKVTDEVRLKALPDWQVNTLANRLAWRSYAGLIVTLLGNIPIIYFYMSIVIAQIIPSYILFVIPLWVLHFWVGRKGSGAIQATVWTTAGRDKARTNLEPRQQDQIVPGIKCQTLPPGGNGSPNKAGGDKS